MVPLPPDRSWGTERRLTTRRQLCGPAVSQSLNRINRLPRACFMLQIAHASAGRNPTAQKKHRTALDRAHNGIPVAKFERVPSTAPIEPHVLVLLTIIE